MINHLRTLSARLITYWLRRTRAWVVRAGSWLAAQADSLDEKRRCLEATLELAADDAPANAASRLERSHERAAARSGAG